MRHHAIVVSSWDARLLERAHRMALDIFGKTVSGTVDSPMNGHTSFFVAPDGSKEGWEDSRLGDERRAAFVDWLNTQRYEDGSSALRWVVVQYGDDEGETVVLDSDEQDPSK